MRGRKEEDSCSPFGEVCAAKVPVQTICWPFTARTLDGRRVELVRILRCAASSRAYCGSSSRTGERAEERGRRADDALYGPATARIRACALQGRDEACEFTCE